MRLLLFAALVVYVAPAAENPLLLENARVRVLKANTVPGQKGGLHDHKVNRVMIHLDAGQMRLVAEDGGVRDATFTAGQVRWDPKVGLHTSENTGGTPYRIVEIEIKGDAPAKPVRLPVRKPKQFVPVMENDQVRVTRVNLVGHDRTDSFKAATPFILVNLSTGESIWRNPGPQEIQNLNVTPVSYVLVE